MCQHGNAAVLRPTAGRCIATLRSHTDYVTCLAASPSAGMLASGGLRGEVMLWDINTLNQVLKSPQVLI